MFSPPPRNRGRKEQTLLRGDAGTMWNMNFPESVVPACEVVSFVVYDARLDFDPNIRHCASRENYVKTTWELRENYARTSWTSWDSVCLHVPLGTASNDGYPMVCVLAYAAYAAYYVSSHTNVYRYYLGRAKILDKVFEKGKFWSTYRLHRICWPQNRFRRNGRGTPRKYLARTGDVWGNRAALTKQFAYHNLYCEQDLV